MSDLLVRLKLDDKGLDAQLKGVSSKFAAAARGIASIALPVAAIGAIAKAVDGLAAIGEESINAVGGLNDLSEQLGISAERLQEFRVLAKDAGIGAAEVDTALAFLNKALGQAALGQGELNKYLAAGGIELKNSEGRIKGASVIWDELSAAVKRGAYTQEQATALAAAAFGRSGTKLVAVMRQTDEQQRKLIETAREYGAIISNDVARAADEYGTKLDLIKAGTEALDNQTKLILAPLTIAWAGLKNEIAGAVAELARAAGLIDDNTTLKQRRLKGLEQLINAHRQYLEVTQNPDPMGDALLQQWVSEWAALKNEIEAAEKARKEAEANFTPAGMADGADPVETDAEKKARERAAKEAADYELKLVTDVYAEKDRLAQLEIDQFADYATTLADEKERVYADELKQLQEWNEVLAEERQRYRAEDLDAYIAYGTQITDAEKQIHQQLTEFTAASTKQRLSILANGFKDATALAATNSKKMFNLNKGLALASAILNTHEAVTAALADKTVPTIARFALAALAAGKGAAEIAAIKSTSFGSGTTPSAAATPTVGGVPVQQDRVITVRGVSANQLFTGRQLVELLNEATKDGAKLVLAN